MKIGFIGTGDITRAIVTGLDRANYGYDEIIVSKRSADVSAMLAETCARVRISDDNQEIADAADILVLAVRPQVAAQVLPSIAFRPGQLVISLVATLTHEWLEKWTGPDVAIVRATPLPFVSYGIGATPILPYHPDAAALFDALGRSISTSSIGEFDAVTASSTFMGTFFGVQEAVVEWLADKGVAHKDAQAYIASVLLGLARTGVERGDESLDHLRETHSTRGGLNEQMFRIFEEQGGVSAFLAGIDSVYDRIRRAASSGSGD